MTVAVDSSIRVAISKDRLRADLIAKDPTPNVVTAENILARLKDGKIPVDDTVEKKEDLNASAP